VETTAFFAGSIEFYASAIRQKRGTGTIRAAALPRKATRNHIEASRFRPYGETKPPQYRFQLCFWRIMPAFRALSQHRPPKTQHLRYY